MFFAFDMDASISISIGGDRSMEVASSAMLSDPTELAGWLL